MKKKALILFRSLLALCMIGFGVMSIIGSDSSDDDDDDSASLSEIGGVWKLTSTTEYDSDSGQCQTTTYDDFDAYTKISDNGKLSFYYAYSGAVYTCSTDDETIEVDEGGYTDEDGDEYTFSVSGDTLTVSAKKTTNGCNEKLVATKVSSSVIENAVDTCGGL